MNHRAEVKLLGGQHGKPIPQIEAHLITEDTEGSGAGAVVLFQALVENMLQEVQIRLHELIKSHLHDMGQVRKMPTRYTETIVEGVHK